MTRILLARAKVMLQDDLRVESNAVERRELEAQIHLVDRMESIYAAGELGEIAYMRKNGLAVEE